MEMSCLIKGGGCHKILTLTHTLPTTLPVLGVSSGCLSSATSGGSWAGAPEASGSSLLHEEQRPHSSHRLLQPHRTQVQHPQCLHWLHNIRECLAKMENQRHRPD